MSFESYTVQPGDTLFTIAQAFYDDGNKWRLIFAANAALIENPDLIHPGWELRIPPSNWVPPKSPSKTTTTTGGGSGSLRRGAKGAAVRALQQELVALGYDLTVDGSFGTATEAAVCDVQSNNDLTVDGIVGPATRQTIASLLEGEAEEEGEDEESDDEEGDDEDEESEDEESDEEEEDDEEGDDEDEDEDEDEEAEDEEAR